MMTQYEEDKRLYFEKKLRGEFTINHWVLLRNGIVLAHTPHKNEALEICSRQDGLCVLFQVGHEDDVISMDGFDDYDLPPGTTY
jgi:hypothetical protein